MLYAGKKVRITKNLIGSKTEEIYSLDSDGNMLNMQGKTFKIHMADNSDKNGFWIIDENSGVDYIFHREDLHPLQTKTPKIKKEKHIFDTKKLVF